jgi:membrane-associated phospholipid phosphatase
VENFFLNIELFRLINGNHTPFWDRFFLFYRYAGTAWVLLPAIFFAAKMRPRRLSVLILAVAVQTLIVYTLKAVFAQPRPAALLENVHLLQPLYKYSFPSGDTAIAFAVAWSFVTRQKRLWVRLLLPFCALLVAYERIYLGVHFPLDVLAGAVIGMACGWGAYYADRKSLIWAARR